MSILSDTMTDSDVESKFFSVIDAYYSEHPDDPCEVRHDTAPYNPTCSGKPVALVHVACSGAIVRVCSNTVASVAASARLGDHCGCKKLTSICWTVHPLEGL